MEKLRWSFTDIVMNFKKRIGKLFTSKFCWDRALVLWKKYLPGRSLTKVEKHGDRRYVISGTHFPNEIFPVLSVSSIIA
jgi:hypothetical protein